MSLITRYRPQTLDEFKGNHSLVQSLKSILQRRKSKLPHSFMFSGPPGCGKTTLARIVAHEIGCEDQDINESNAAQSTGIEFVREVNQWMAFKPTNGWAKSFILDECHRLSAAAQDGLLKPVEEPPKHVFFMFCTTEQQSVKATLKRRCEQFEVRALTEAESFSFIEEVLKEENAKVPKEIIGKIIEAADSRPGQCLSLLDKVIGLDQKDMEVAIAQQSMWQSQIIDLCRALMSRANWAEIAKIINGLEDDPESVRRAVLGYCNAVALKSPKQVGAAYLVLDAFLDPFFNSGKPGLTAACYRAINL